MSTILANCQTTLFFFFQIATENAGFSGEAGSVVTVTFTSFVAVQIFHTLGNRCFPLG